MPTKSFWVVRNGRHQDYIYRTPSGVKLRFASREEAKAALDEAMRVYPREHWEITELQSYIDRVEPESSPNEDVK